MRNASQSSRESVRVSLYWGSVLLFLRAGIRIRLTKLCTVAYVKQARAPGGFLSLVASGCAELVCQPLLSGPGKKQLLGCFGCWKKMFRPSFVCRFVRKFLVALCWGQHANVGQPGRPHVAASLVNRHAKQSFTLCPTMEADWWRHPQKENFPERIFFFERKLSSKSLRSASIRDTEILPCLFNVKPDQASFAKESHCWGLLRVPCYPSNASFVWLDEFPLQIRCQISTKRPSGFRF